MNKTKRWRLINISAGVGLLALCYTSAMLAAINNPADHLQLPSSIQNVTPVQKQLLEAKQRFNQLTPAEKQALVQKAQDHLNDLSPAQKQELHQAAQREFNQVTPAQKQQLQQAAQSEFGNLTPAQKQALLQPKAEPAN